MNFMNRPARRTLFLLAALSFSGGCATKGDLRNLQDEVRQLSARQDSLLIELRNQSLATQDTLRTTSSQLFDIRGQVVQLLREVRDDQMRTAELLRENQRAIAGIRDQLASQRRSVVSQPGAEGDAPVVSPDGTAVAPAVTPGSSGGDPVSLYNAAIEQYQRQAYTAARAGFELFLESYPGDADLAPWAIFYLAETVVQQDDREWAVSLYSEIPERFPVSEAVPQALYRLGLTLIELDRVDEAREALQRVANTWPDSDAGALARARLSELSGALL